MPICTKCGLPRETDDFPWRDKKGGVRKRYCRTCQSKYHEKWGVKHAANYRHAWRKQNSRSLQAWLREYKDGKTCMDCGKPWRYYVLDFDHRDPTTKRRGVAWMVNGTYSLAALQREIAKCDLVCANCHRERTFGRKAKGRSPLEVPASVGEVRLSLDINSVPSRTL